MAAAEVVITCSFSELPEVILRYLFDCFLGNFQDMLSVSMVDREMRDISNLIRFDSNANVYENELKTYSRLLYKSINACGDERSSWRNRIHRIHYLTRISQKDKTQLKTHISSCVTPSTYDLILYSHPTYGLQINLGVVKGAVVLYGIRDNKFSRSFKKNFAANNGVTFTEGMLAPFNIPRCPVLLAPHDVLFETMVVVCCINGRKVSSFADIIELTTMVRKSHELSSWKVLFFPVVENAEECLLQISSEYKFPTILRSPMI